MREGEGGVREGEMDVGRGKPSAEGRGVRGTDSGILGSRGCGEAR